MYYLPTPLLQRRDAALHGRASLRAGTYGNWQDAGWSRNPVGPEYNERTLDVVPADGIRPRDYYGNFVEFFNKKENGKPFFIWYGGHEPHRRYEDGSGKRDGKKLDEMVVPSFLPDEALVRSDIADYIMEIEWFDKHLEKMINFLEEEGELNNTIIVVTADNGMPFPYAKANVQEYGTHVPLSICWSEKLKGGRIVDNPVGLIDLDLTFLEMAGIEINPEMTGQSLSPVLFRSMLEEDLKTQGDPRMFGSEIFDSYPRISSMRNLPGFKKRGEYDPAYQ